MLLFTLAKSLCLCTRVNMINTVLFPKCLRAPHGCDTPIPLKTSVLTSRNKDVLLQPSAAGKTKHRTLVPCTPHFLVSFLAPQHPSGQKKHCTFSDPGCGHVCFLDWGRALQPSLTLTVLNARQSFADALHWVCLMLAVLRLGVHGLGRKPQA